MVSQLVDPILTLPPRLTRLFVDGEHANLGTGTPRGQLGRLINQAVQVGRDAGVLRLEDGAEVLGLLG